jgi:hypothetical protein
MSKLFFILPMLFFVSSLVSASQSMDMKKDGFYVVKMISTKGVVKKVYHFVDDESVHQLLNVNSTTQELLSWYNSPDKIAANYFVKSSKKLVARGSSRNSIIRLNSSGMIKNSVFYQVVGGKIVSEKIAKNEPKMYHYKIFNPNAKPVYNGDLTSVKEIAKGYYLLESDGVSKIIDTNGQSVSADYAWIGSKTENYKHLMAYDGQNFCVISYTGKIEIPCTYQNMVEYKENRYVISNNGNEKLVDWRGNVLFEPKKDESFSKTQWTNNVFILDKKGQKTQTFWSNKAKKYLDITTEKHREVIGTDSLWLVKTDKGFSLLDEMGEIKVKLHLKSSYVFKEYLIAKDTQGSSHIFKLDDLSTSKVLPGSINFMFDSTTTEDSKGNLLYYEPLEGQSALINTQGEILQKGRFKKKYYIGEGFYMLKIRYKTYLYSEKSGLTRMPLQSIRKYNKTMFNIRTKDFYGFWDHTSKSWFKKPEKYTYVVVGDDSIYASYGINNVGKSLGFLDENGQELTPAIFEGRTTIRFDKAIIRKDGSIRIVKLPEVKEILVVKGKSAHISDFGSIIVYTKIK